MRLPQKKSQATPVLSVFSMFERRNETIADGWTGLLLRQIPGRLAARLTNYKISCRSAAE